MLKKSLISKNELSIFKVVDSADSVVRIIRDFYKK